MINNKPLIIAKRPFWRHPVFPWGWYSTTSDNIFSGEADGYYKPDGKICFDHTSTEPANDGDVFMPRVGTVGRWKRQTPIG